MSVRKRVKESHQNSTHNTRTMSQNYSQNQRYSRIQHSSSHLVKRKSKLKKKKASRSNMTETTCVSHSSFSFFLSSSYTRMMQDQIESHERMRESVCVILTDQIQLRQRRVLLQSLRNRLCTFVSDLVPCFIHERKK